MPASPHPFQAVMYGIPRDSRLVASWILAFHLAGCGFGVPVKKPEIVSQQAQQATTIHVGESTRESVRSALGEPWLQSRYWSFDLFRAKDTSTEVGGMVILVWPVPMGVFKSQVEGYVLITYDQAGRVTHASSGSNQPGALGEQSPLLLKAGGLYLGLEKTNGRGTQLIADAGMLRDYLAQRKRSNTCTLILACEEVAPQKWPYEACPDRVVIDGMAPIDPRPFFGSCEPDSTCPPKTLQAGQYVHIPLVHPVSLPPGSHRVEMSSSTFKGRHQADFVCNSGDVRFGLIKGKVEWDWWSPRTSSLNTSLILEDALPESWKSYGVLLYRDDHWLAAPEPGQF